jgi:uncharacterized protein YbjT (DUF2867 family)
MSSKTPILALTATTGKLGGATLKAILDYNLHPPSHLVLCTSSDPSSPKFTELRDKGAQIRQANYSDYSSLVSAFQGVDRVFIVSTPVVVLDYQDDPSTGGEKVKDGNGREGQHYAAINAAREAGVKYVYYTSLGFGWDKQRNTEGRESVAGVMRAHIRTEEYLEKNLGTAETWQKGEEEGTKWCVLREGLYNESWPLYLGHFTLGKDERKELVVAGDGPLSWTSISDLGLATALILVAEPQKWMGRIVSLSARKLYTLKESAEIVGKARGMDMSVKVVSKDEHEQFYIHERGMNQSFVKWWSSSYEAIRNGECATQDSTLEELLKEKGRTPKPFEETVAEMVSK